MKVNTTAWQQISIVASIAAVLFLGGCCNKYKTNIASQQDEIYALKNEKSQIEEDLATCNGKCSDLDGKIAKMLEQQEELVTKINDIEAEKEQLIKDHDAALAKISDKDKMLKELKEKQALARERLKTFKKMLQQFKKLIATGKLKVKIHKGKMVLELPSAILFESGKAGLSEEGQSTLEEVAKVLSKIQNREFQVSGHTDNVPIKSGKYPSNWELSTARAVTVVKYLEKNNVKSKNISAAGYSEFQPVSSNKSSDGKAQNRRIEIVIMPNLDELPDLSELEKELAQ